MRRWIGSIALGLAGLGASGCETPPQSIPTPATVTAAPPTCQTSPITLADGSVVQATCGTYRQCTLFKPAAPAGSRSTGLPFFVLKSGLPVIDHPGAGNCL